MWVSKKRFDALVDRVAETEALLKTKGQELDYLVKALTEAGVVKQADFYILYSKYCAQRFEVMSPIKYHNFVRDIEAYLNIEKVSEPPRYQKRRKA